MLKKMLSWFRSPPKDVDAQLGVILTKVMDVCTSAELGRGMALHLQSGKQLGQCLVSLEVIDDEQLRAALRLQKQLRNGGATDALLEALHTRADRKRESNERKKTGPRLVRTTYTPPTAAGHGLAAAK